jgi:hypothetical protein
LYRVQFIFPKELSYERLAGLSYARDLMLILANYMLFAVIPNDLRSEFLFSGDVGRRGLLLPSKVHFN